MSRYHFLTREQLDKITGEDQKRYQEGGGRLRKILQG